MAAVHNAPKPFDIVWAVIVTIVLVKDIKVCLQLVLVATSPCHGRLQGFRKCPGPQHAKFDTVNYVPEWITSLIHMP